MQHPSYNQPRAAAVSGEQVPLNQKKAFDEAAYRTTRNASLSQKIRSARPGVVADRFRNVSGLFALPGKWVEIGSPIEGIDPLGPFETSDDEVGERRGRHFHS